MSKAKMTSKKIATYLVLSEVLVALVTIAFYILLGKFNWTVITGSILGVGLASLYYILLSASMNKAANEIEEARGNKELSEEEIQKFVEENEKKFQAKVQFAFYIRIGILLAVLILAFITKWFAVFATIVPLLLISPILMVIGYFVKDKGKEK